MLFEAGKDTNKFCANADNYAFEFDSGVGLKRAKEAAEFVWAFQILQLRPFN